MDRILRGNDAIAGDLAYAGPKLDRDMTYSDVSAAGGAVWVAHRGGVHRTRDGGARYMGDRPRRGSAPRGPASSFGCAGDHVRLRHTLARVRHRRRSPPAAAL